ncbi:MAG TPA: ATP-binding protein [Longimicrobium sp.]|nr:ATP-binding protein [Longimicrobium sp.]
MSAVSAVSIPLVFSRHAALEALADGFCMADAEYRITYWNAAAERLFGLPRAEVLGRELWTAIPGLADPEVRARLHGAMDHRAPLRLTVVSDAELFARYFTVHAAPLEEGGLALHLRDATGEQRLADQYEQLLESIRDGFVAVDRDWRIVYVNRSAEVLLSLRRDRALGLDLRRLLPPGAPELAPALRATMADRERRHLRMVRPEGPVLQGRCFDVWTHALPDGGLSLLFEDTTDRLAGEVELARLAAEAEEANRAKSRFFAAVSHELRTPLNAIVGYTHLLSTLTWGDMPPDAVRAAERAGVCAEHLARLVDDVLLLTTMEIDRLRMAPEPVWLAEFLPGVLQHLRQQAAGKGLAFALDLPPDLPPLRTDPERLRQVVSQLVTNAIKFTPRGAVRLAARVDGGTMEIAVTDTGPGIPDDARERIFEAFEQVGDGSRSDSLSRGTGLGLTVARQLARVMEGTLEVECPEPGGTCFRLRLPLRTPQP